MGNLMFTGQVDGPISNKEDWTSIFYRLTDDDGNVINILNEDIDFDCSVYIADLDGCLRLQTNLGEGKIEVSEDGNGDAGFQWRFSKADLASLCAGTYKCGVKVTMNGDASDIIIGTLPIVEGNGA